MDRHNGRIVILSAFLHYLAAPVIYVGIVQAALCDRLGASATVANLPSSGYLLASVAPILLSWVVPHRRVRATVVTASLLTSLVLFVVLLVLLFPFQASIVALILVLGLSSKPSREVN